MKALFKIAAIALAAGAALGAHAQDYPAAGKTITLIVPFTAGGPTDKVARDLAESMRKQLNNATIVVDNADGAGSTIGTAKAARARPDGYTLLINHIGMSTIPSLYRKLSFNVLNDFEYAGIINDVPMTLIGRPSLPAKNFAEVKDWIGKNQGKVNLANAGIGSASHLCGLMLQASMKTEMTPVPYKGAAPAIADLIGNQVDLLCDQTTNTTQQIDSGKVKAYAVTSLQRVPTLPKLPTMDESGFKGFEVGIWHGMWVPKGTPKPVVDKLVKSLQAGLADPKFQERMKQLGATVLTADANPQALDAKVKQQVPQWAELFKKAGVEQQ